MFAKLWAVMVSLMLTFASTSTFADEIDLYMNKTVEWMSKKLPIAMSGNLKLTSVSYIKIFDERRFTYIYEYSPTISLRQAKNVFTDPAKAQRTWCTDPSLDRFRKSDIVGHFKYLLADGTHVATLIARSDKCQLSSVTTDAESNFALVKLPRGVRLQIPKGWWLLGKDYKQLIQTSVEESMDLSGIGLPDGQAANLIAANSMPRSTYAAVRVDSTIPPSIMPSELSSISPAEFRQLKIYMRQLAQKLLRIQGHKLINFFGLRLETISDHPAIVSEYRRTGPKGPVIVQINQIYTATQEIRVNLSYRESETVLWKPVIGKIRKSIVIR